MNTVKKRKNKRSIEKEKYDVCANYKRIILINMIRRDEKIDILRGLAMMWVIVVHVVFWLPFFRNGTISTLKSLILFEMPLFFFISGASITLSKQKKFSTFLISKFKRIIIPYWIYIIVCLSLDILLGLYDNFYQLSFIIPYKVPTLFGPFLTSALWFIRPFLLVILSSHFLYKYFNMCETNIKKVLPLCLLVILIILIDVSNLSCPIFKCFILFQIFTYLGFFYRIIENNIKNKQLYIILSAFLITLVLLVKSPFYILDMQFNKFEYNLVFLIYGSIMLIVIKLLSDHIVNIYKYITNNNIIKLLLEPFVNNTYTIFLFHPLVFLFLTKLVDRFSLQFIYTNNPYINCAIITIMALIGSSLIGRLFSFVEKINFKEKQLI
ncbi:MAG: acyltransferase [Clostridia bacterium]